MHFEAIVDIRIAEKCAAKEAAVLGLVATLFAVPGSLSPSSPSLLSANLLCP
jgi:hypothetical protein